MNPSVACSTLLVTCLFLSSGGVAGADEPATAGKQYALLVGCTTYDCNITELWGPSNDVLAWTKLLTEQFGFPETNITRMLRSLPKAEQHPTRANIVRGFETLIATVRTGDKVFILLSGHGCQVPIPEDQNPLAANNPEPDGLDEVFLPVDVQMKNGVLQNHILDDEIGQWLDRIRDKGADVMIVFDCCHSGTMTRGLLREMERHRTVRAQDLGIPDASIKAALARANTARSKAQKEGRNLEAESVKIRGKKEPKERGSLAAFYAAQPFQTAPELPLPKGVEPVRENYYGMLSWTLIQILRDSPSSLSYRELEQVMIARYRSIRGTREPIPFAEGDTDGEVLGFRQWPSRSRVLLQVVKDKPLRVSAGQLAGLTPGTILAVYPPLVDVDLSTGLKRNRDPKKLLGYLKVAEKPSAYDAEVLPIDYAPPNGQNQQPNVPAPKREDLDDQCRCEVVARDYGEMRVKMLLPSDAMAKAAFDAIDKEVRDMIVPVNEEAAAEWVLKVVDPKTAAIEYGLKEGLIENHLLLVRANGFEIDPAKQAALADQLSKVGKAAARQVYGAYPVSDFKRLTADLERDIQKLFKWQNIWRVSAGISGERGGNSLGVTLEVRRLRGAEDLTGDLLRSGSVPNKGFLGFHVKNNGKHDVWVVAILLDAELGIDQYEVIQVPAYSKEVSRLSNAQVVNPDGVVGTEGLVLFVFSQEVQKERPDFKFLNQTPLRVDEKLTRDEKGRNLPKTPFHQLLAQSTLYAGERAAVKVEPTTPAVIVGSWFVTPELK